MLYRVYRLTTLLAKKYFMLVLKKQNGNDVVTAGGRVLCATALGNTVTEAQQRAYELIKTTQLGWHGISY